MFQVSHCRFLAEIICMTTCQHAGDETAIARWCSPPLPTTIPSISVVEVIGVLRQRAESRNECIVEWMNDKALRTELHQLRVSQQKMQRPTACRVAVPKYRSRTMSTGARERRTRDCARD